MLYQFTLYALWQNNPQRRVVILSPVMEEAAIEQAIYFINSLRSIYATRVFIDPCLDPAAARNLLARKREVALVRTLAVGEYSS